MYYKQVTGVALTSINESLSDNARASIAPSADPKALKNPIKVKEHVIVGNKMAVSSLAEVTGFVMAQTTFIMGCCIAENRKITQTKQETA